jgi:hypothetical protein
MSHCHNPHCIPLMGYRHMYRSLLRFFPINDLRALELLYRLYIGNLDSCQYAGIPLIMMELTPDGFYSLTTPLVRPYHTEVQLYRSMNGLLRNIHHEATIQDTRSAVRQFHTMIESLERRFENTYGCSITDPKTTYDECWNRLTIRNSEPLTAFKCIRAANNTAPSM